MTAVSSKIDTLLESLNAPLSSQEMADGWITESKHAMAEYFTDLQRRLAVGEVPASVIHVLRALDHWGVRSGALLDLAVEISNDLRTSAKS
jgi:hypothetical protein